MAQTEAQKRAQAKWNAKNREKNKYLRDKSTAKTFVNKSGFENADDLMELKKMIDEKLLKMEDIKMKMTTSESELMSKLNLEGKTLGAIEQYQPKGKSSFADKFWAEDVNKFLLMGYKFDNDAVFCHDGKPYIALTSVTSKYSEALGRDVTTDRIFAVKDLYEYLDAKHGVKL